METKETTSVSLIDTFSKWLVSYKVFSIDSPHNVTVDIFIDIEPGDSRRGVPCSRLGIVLFACRLEDEKNIMGIDRTLDIMCSPWVLWTNTKTKLAGWRRLARLKSSGVGMYSRIKTVSLYNFVSACPSLTSCRTSTYTD